MTVLHQKMGLNFVVIQYINDFSFHIFPVPSIFLTLRRLIALTITKP